MPNAENTNCAKCDGTGFLDYRGYSMNQCAWCQGAGTIEQSSIVASVVKESLTTQVHNRLEGLREWADDNCPEGVACIPDDVRWLLSYAEGVATADLHRRCSDAITLLYTHGLLTEKARAHARNELSKIA